MRISFCSNSSVLKAFNHGQFHYYIDPYNGNKGSLSYFSNSHPNSRYCDAIKIHRDIGTKLRKDLEEIPPQTIFIGYNTEPYQPLEDSLHQTRIVLELLHEKGFSVNLFTMSDLVKRDIDLLKRMPDSKICMPLFSADDDLSDLFERNTSRIEHRFQTLREIRAHGVRTSVKIGPIIPKISDTKTIVSKVQHVTDDIELHTLSFNDKRGEDWIRFEEILYKNCLDSAEEIETIIFSKDHVYWLELRNELEVYRSNKNLNFSLKF